MLIKKKMKIISKHLTLKKLLLFLMIKIQIIFLLKIAKTSICMIGKKILILKKYFAIQI